MAMAKPAVITTHVRVSMEAALSAPPWAKAGAAKSNTPNTVKNITESCFKSSSFRLFLTGQNEPF
jgi:hypothetical protein